MAIPIQKEDLSVFIWKKIEALGLERLRVLTPDAAQTLGDPKDIELSAFIPLTEASLGVISMLHPNIPLDLLRQAYRDWECYSKPEDRWGYDGYYSYISIEHGWG